MVTSGRATSGRARVPAPALESPLKLNRQYTRNLSRCCFPCYRHEEPLEQFLLCRAQGLSHRSLVWWGTHVCSEETRILKAGSSWGVHPDPKYRHGLSTGTGLASASPRAFWAETNGCRERVCRQSWDQVFMGGPLYLHLSPKTSATAILVSLKERALL